MAFRASCHRRRESPVRAKAKMMDRSSGHCASPACAGWTRAQDLAAVRCVASRLAFPDQAGACCRGPRLQNGCRDQKNRRPAEHDQYSMGTAESRHYRPNAGWTKVAQLCCPAAAAAYDPGPMGTCGTRRDLHLARHWILATLPGPDRSLPGPRFSPDRDSPGEAALPEFLLPGRGENFDQPP